MKNYFVYITANKPKGTLYIGVTNDIVRRIWEHKNKLVDGFTKQYSVDRLVYFEMASDVQAAISREKQLKAWRRQWKIELIESNNPKWRDLYPEFNRCEDYCYGP